MDYDEAYAKERLSGRGYFLATGDTSEIDLGNIEMLKIDFGIKRKQHFRSRRGVQVLDRDDAYASEAKWTLTIDEFTTPTLPFAWAGTPNADFNQTIGTGATFMFTSKKGKVFKIGKYGLHNASLTTPVSKVEGVDYVIDRAGGRIYIPLGSSIADATACTVTYSAPALVYDSVNALTVLNRPGTLEIHGEDDSGSGQAASVDAVPPVRYAFVFPCILSADSSGDFKSDDYRKITLLAVMTGAMLVKRLKT
jgi:hypothetical protein